MGRVRRSGLAVVAALAAIASAGCNNDTPSTFTPTIVTPPSTTEIFTGTVAVGGADAHAFTTSNFGQLDVTLTSAGPPDTVVMGLGVGTPVSASCQIFQNSALSTPAGASPQISGNLQAGTYCIQVFDVGQQTGPVTYSVTVVHPQ